jgi:hypothetical protein
MKQYSLATLAGLVSIAATFALVETSRMLKNGPQKQNSAASSVFKMLK